MIKELKSATLDTRAFIKTQVTQIAETVGDGTAINALSGGVDSSVVTLLGHRALGKRLRTVFVENGIMREGEAGRVKSMFAKLGVKVEVVDAKDEFFAALKGITDPRRSARPSRRRSTSMCSAASSGRAAARFLLQGTILTDVDETVAGIKRQHNVFEQLGIDPQETFGYRILEPLIQLRKDGVRKVGKAAGPARRIVQAHSVPRARARGTRDRRGHAGAHRHRPKSHGDRRKGAVPDEGLSVHGHSACGPRDRHAGQ